MSNYKKITDRIEELIIDNPKTASTLKWLNVTNAGKNEIDHLRKNYHFDLIHSRLAAASVSFQRPMIFRGPDYLCLVLHFPTFKDKRIVAAEIDFFIGHGFLVTVNNNSLKSLSGFFNSARKSPETLLAYSLESSAILLYEILSHLFDGCYRLLDENSLKINEIEDLIFSDKQRVAVRHILILRRNIVNIRRIMQNHKNILQKLMEMESSFVTKEVIRKYYTNLIDHSKRIWETLENQKELIEVLNNTNESMLQNQMNNIMRVLTMFSVIIFPLTLFAAIFSMRTEGMPLVDNPSSFWIIIGTMAIVCLAMLTLFKRKKWL